MTEQDTEYKATTDQEEHKIEVNIKEMEESINDAINKYLMKSIEKGFSEKDELPIYEKLSPGEIMIISRSQKGFLVAANGGGIFDIRYYSESEE